MKRLFQQLLANIIIIDTVYLISFSLYSGFKIHNTGVFTGYALFYYLLHLVCSLIFRKYESNERYDVTKLIKLYFRSWIYSSGLVLLIIYSFQLGYLSRFLVLSNMFGIFMLELVFITILTSLRSSVVFPDRKQEDTDHWKEDSVAKPVYNDTHKVSNVLNVYSNVLDEMGEEALYFISRYLDEEAGKTLILNTTSRFNILNQPYNSYTKIVNLHKLNDVRYVNQFLEAINSKIPNSGLIALCAETKNMRKERILNDYPPLLNYVYYFFDFVVMRVFPKISFTRKLYFMISKGRNRVMSRAEILGRICSCGFRIIDEQTINRKFYVIAQKIGIPAYNSQATYGPFIHLERIGKGGQIIKVYKFRTMHPFSEYLQAYVYNNNKLQKGGKLMDDFRVTSHGKLMRKIWFDELPMIINLLSGELKIVGVRPLSRHFFSLYPPDMQLKRTQFKPGLVPPFYADMPETLEEIIDSERRYLDAYAKSPLLTDILYFYKAFFNIAFRKVRSK